MSKQRHARRGQIKRCADSSTCEVLKAPLRHEQRTPPVRHGLAPLSPSSSNMTHRSVRQDTERERKRERKEMNILRSESRRAHTTAASFGRVGRSQAGPGIHHSIRTSRASMVSALAAFRLCSAWVCAASQGCALYKARTGVRTSCRLLLPLDYSVAITHP